MGTTRRILAGRYELVDVVGRGGMGTVYRATDNVLRRTVAVKLLAAALLEDPVHVARFEREARAVASLANPGIVAVYDTGVDHGSHFIVMEFVSGRSLAELIAADGRVDPDRAVRLAVGVADALAAAHAAGLVHRDVKPANVMITDDGIVKVLDFGIARAVDGTALTQTASVLGTAAYMAPEQALGDRADARSDIYSLGCVLYALLTGRPPFEGDAAPAITHQHVHAAPVSLRAGNRRLPAALDALVMEMLSKSPGARPQTALEVRDRLRTVLSPAVAVELPATRVAARGAGATLPTARMPPAATAPVGVRPAADRRRRRLATAVAVCIALAAVIVAVSLDRSSGHGATGTAARGVTALGKTSSADGLGASTTSASTVTGTTTADGPAVTSPTGATGPAGSTTPTSSGTVAGAAGALGALVSEASQVGAVSQQAAKQLSAGLAGVVAALATGNTPAAQKELVTLTQQIGMLETGGQIGGAMATALNAALGALSSAVGAPAAAGGAPAVSAPAAAGSAPGVSAPAGKQAKPAGHGGPGAGRGHLPFGPGRSFRG